MDEADLGLSGPVVQLVPSIVGCQERQSPIRSSLQHDEALVSLGGAHMTRSGILVGCVPGHGPCSSIYPQTPSFWRKPARCNLALNGSNLVLLRASA